MTDDELCELIAKIWVDNGGDVEGIYWNIVILRKKIEEYIEEKENEQCNVKTDIF